MAYTIRPAVWADFDRIEEIYAQARQFMRETGNPNQWGAANPPRAQTEADIRAGQLYVMAEGETIRGVFFLSLEPDSTYAVIYNGAWHSEEPYAVIHRIAGTGGVVKAAVAFAKEQRNYIRIDTHEDNKVMQHVLNKLGFRLCGTIHLANGDPRIAFDLLP